MLNQTDVLTDFDFDLAGRMWEAMMEILAKEKYLQNVSRTCPVDEKEYSLTDDQSLQFTPFRQ